MRLRNRILWLLLVAASAICLSAAPPRPACNAENSGRLWPDAANRDPKALKKSAHCGELQICTRGAWRYRWEFLTVRLDQLRHSKTPVYPAGCEELSSDDLAGAVRPPATN